ncbi:MAG: hypothetical protein WC390_10330 [Sulfurimonas sp.]
MKTSEMSGTLLQFNKLGLCFFRKQLYDLKIIKIENCPFGDNPHWDIIFEFNDGKIVRSLGLPNLFTARNMFRHTIAKVRQFLSNLPAIR